MLTTKDEEAEESVLEPAVRAHVEKAVEELSHFFFAVDTHTNLRLVDHCARVAAVAERISGQTPIAQGEVDVLLMAARIHEVGMLAISPVLVQHPHTLAREQIDQIRGQAAVGAEIVEAWYGQRVASLVRHQYTCYEQLLANPSLDAPTRLLAGVLRVADVIAATTWPRPYQRRIEWSRTKEFLRRGVGTRYHPTAVHGALSAFPMHVGL